MAEAEQSEPLVSSLTRLNGREEFNVYITVKALNNVLRNASNLLSLPLYRDLFFPSNFVRCLLLV